MSELARLVLDISGRLLDKFLGLITTFCNISGNRCVRLMIGMGFNAHWSRVKVFLP